MSIGSHSIGKLFMSVRAAANSGLSALTTSNKVHTMPQGRPVEVNEEIPKAPLNPWRKRPVKVTYDPTHYQMFRLPSEKAFLFQGNDYNDVFGERKGMNHAPHIRNQINLDTNLVFAFVFLTGVLLLMEPGRTHKIVTLRENMRNCEQGKFTEEDFN